MQIELNEFSNFIVLAGNGNNLKRYKVSGKELTSVFTKFERVCYIGKIECFECYTKNPETNEGGWDIVYIEGVKEKIKKYYPHFDCFITTGYPHSSVEAIEFLQLEHDNYELSELK